MNRDEFKQILVELATTQVNDIGDLEIQTLLSRPRACSYCSLITDTHQRIALRRIRNQGGWSAKCTHCRQSFVLNHKLCGE